MGNRPWRIRGVGWIRRRHQKMDVVNDAERRRSTMMRKMNATPAKEMKKIDETVRKQISKMHEIDRGGGQR